MRRVLRFSLFFMAIALVAPHARAEDGEPDEVHKAILADLEAWDIEGAEAKVKDLEAKSPDDPGTLYLAGRVAFEEGDYDKAVDLFAKSLGPGAEDSEDFKLALGAQQEMAHTVTEESAHFVIRYKPGKDAALVPYAMDTLEAAYAALTRDLGYEPPRKVRIEFVSTPRALARISSLTEQAIKTTGTIALCKYNRLMVTSPRALVRGYEWEDTMAHEFTHFLITRKTRNTVPIWLHEGLAKYEETRWRGKAGLALEPGSDALLARAVKNDKLITFERMHPSIALLPSQEDAALAYAEVLTAVQFVDQKLGMAGIRAILDKMKAGKSDEDAIAEAMGMPFAKFEAAWKVSLKNRPAPKVAPGFEKLVFKDDPNKKETKEEHEKSYERGELGTLQNPDARKHAHLGELLRARSRLVPAALEYEQAIALGGGTHPALARKYAMTMIALGRGTDAEKVLKESLAAFPDDETNHLLYGRILVESGRASMAKDHFLIALQRDPFDDEIHLGLAAVGKLTSDQGLLAREKDVLQILQGQKQTWRAPAPGAVVSEAYLRVEGPGGAKVFLDGVDTGLTTPVQDFPVPSGKHVVRLVPENGSAVEKTIDFAPDQVVPFPQS